MINIADDDMQQRACAPVGRILKKTFAPVRSRVARLNSRIEVLMAMRCGRWSDLDKSHEGPQDVLL
jgi:hypothetical protein